MYKSLLSLAVFLPAHTMAAQAVEHCPSPSSIIDSHGTYHAAARDPLYQWVAIPAPGNGGSVEHFEEAVFYPDDQLTTRGELARCSYKLERGALDLAYRGASGRPKSQLHDRSAWTRERGPFDIPYDLCKNGDGTTCTFRVTHD